MFIVAWSLTRFTTVYSLMKSKQLLPAVSVKVSVRKHAVPVPCLETNV